MKLLAPTLRAILIPNLAGLKMRLSFGPRASVILFRCVLRNMGPGQTLDFFDEGRLEVQGVAHQQIQETAPHAADQILQQGEGTGYLGLAVLLEANAQRDGE